MDRNSFLRWMISINLLFYANGRAISGPVFCNGKYICLFSSLLEILIKLLRYYIDPPAAVVYGKPSAALAEKLENDEKVRIAKQVENLGPDGLKKAAEELEAAKAEHGKPIPTEVLTSFPVPDVNSIAWIPVQTVQEPGKGRKRRESNDIDTLLSKHILSDGTILPFFVEYDHVQVGFKYINSSEVLSLSIIV